MRIGCKILLGGVAAVALFSACKKDVKAIYQPGLIDSSLISITNASPSVADLQFYLNDQLTPLPNSPLSFGKTASVMYVDNPTSYRPDTTLLPYINIPAGYQQLDFGSQANIHLNTISQRFDSKAHYSIFVTDTIIHGKLASVVLKDSLLIADTTRGQLRFINLSPDAPPMDLWIYPDAGYNGYKLFSNCGYLPTDFNSYLKAQSFTVLDAGPYYLEATTANTSNVLLGGFLYIPGQNVVTIYAKGYVGGSGEEALSVGVIQYKQLK